MSDEIPTTNLDEDLIEVAAMAIWEEYPAPLPAYASIPELSLEEVCRGDLRRMARAAVRAYLGRELMRRIMSNPVSDTTKCECGAMSEDDCNDLPSLRHCGGATQATEPEYTREEMREACLNNYNAGLLHAMEVVLKCPDETPPVEVFRAIQAELKQRDEQS